MVGLLIRAPIAQHEHRDAIGSSSCIVDRDFRAEFALAREADVEHGLIVLPAMTLGDFVAQRVVLFEIVSDVFTGDGHQCAQSEILKIRMSHQGSSCLCCGNEVLIRYQRLVIKRLGMRPIE